MSDQSGFEWFDQNQLSMKSAMVIVVQMAKEQGRICYLYIGKATKEFLASHTYWDDWLFKAYPGGRKQLSIKGSELLKGKQNG